jgi:hypothetical protein
MNGFSSIWRNGANAITPSTTRKGYLKTTFITILGSLFIGAGDLPTEGTLRGGVVDQERVRLTFEMTALLEPDLAQWEVVACPEIHWDLSYRFKKDIGQILRCRDIDRDRTFEMLYRRMRQFGPNQQPTSPASRLAGDSDFEEYQI